VSRDKIKRGGRIVARNYWQELSRLGKRVDRHDEDIRELKAMRTADRRRLDLQQEGLDLLGQLAKNHTDRIALIEQDENRPRGANRKPS